MFEFIRTHQRLMQFLLLLIIFPSFAFVGIESYSSMGDGKDVLAKVGKYAITQPEWEAAQREQIDRYRQALGAQFDQKMLETPEAKQNILDSLIVQRALSAEVARNHLSISDHALQQTILAIPGMTDAGGKFDNERYKSVLVTRGMTPAMYEARLRQDLALQQLNNAIQATAFAPKSVATRLSDINDQEREVQELLFKATDYVSQVKVTDDMLKAYYDKNTTQFEVPEQAKIEYVLLSNEVVAAQLNVSDADVKSYYDQNTKRYTVEEQRRASHILIATKSDASAADKAAAKSKAEKLLGQLRKSPSEFAKLAKENSDDPGSAEQGGDLDFIGKGMMVKSFEDAVFKLKTNEISELVQSEFGYHIIQLTGLKPASVKKLDEVKSEIATDIKKQQATKKYAELAELFTNTVYEQADSLKPAADKLKLKIEVAANVTHLPNPTLAPNVPYNNAKFLKTLFSDEAIKNKRNTEAVEIAPNVLISGRIIDYKPTTKRPFDEVKNAIRERVTQTEAATLAKKAGEEKLAALKQKDDATGFSVSKNVSRTKAGDMNGAVQVAVMKADVSKLPAYSGIELAGRGYSIVRISKVSQPANADTARRQSEQQELASIVAQQEMITYAEVLKQKAKVKIVKPFTNASVNDK